MTWWNGPMASQWDTSYISWWSQRMPWNTRYMFPCIGDRWKCYSFNQVELNLKGLGGFLAPPFNSKSIGLWFESPPAITHCLTKLIDNTSWSTTKNLYGLFAILSSPDRQLLHVRFNFTGATSMSPRRSKEYIKKFDKVSKAMLTTQHFSIAKEKLRSSPRIRESFGH